jgi:hypothetical protein
MCSPAKFPLEEEDGDMALAGGPHTSAREGEKECTNSGYRVDRGPFLELGRKFPPRPFFIFLFSSFSFFWFLYLFTTFAS